MTAGYSGTPLVRRLGIKPGHLVAVLRGPDGFAYADLPADVTLRTSLRGTQPLDVIHLFVDRRRDLDRLFPRAAARLTQSGGLWISWPKKSSGVTTDVTETIVRETGLAHGLVDNKICAVDTTWSGLRFVIRLKDRR